jgi:hypothetical protein
MFAMPLARRPYPWLVGDVLSVLVADVVGLGLLMGALYGTRHTTDPDRLVLLLNVAAAGLIVSLAGNAVFFLTGLRQVGQLRTELLGRPADGEAAAGSGADVPANTAYDAVAEDELLVAADNMTRYHRSSCPAVVGKAVSPAGEDRHLSLGRRPCGLCLPPTGLGSSCTS